MDKKKLLTSLLNNHIIAVGKPDAFLVDGTPKFCLVVRFELVSKLVISD